MRSIETVTAPIDADEEYRAQLEDEADRLLEQAARERAEDRTGTIGHAHGLLAAGVRDVRGAECTNCGAAASRLTGEMRHGMFACSKQCAGALLREMLNAASETKEAPKC